MALLEFEAVALGEFKVTTCLLNVISVSLSFGCFCGILCSDDIFSHLQVSESQMVTCSFLCVRGFVDSSQDATWLFVVHLRQMLALVFPSLKYAVKVTIAIVLTSEGWSLM